MTLPPRPATPSGWALPKATAALTERSAISDVMHANAPEIGAKGQAGYIPSGEEVDRMFNAYKTAQEYTEGAREPSHFLERWLSSGLVGGKFGKLVGAAAQSKTWWSALRGQSYKKLAALLKAGKEAEAINLVRTFTQSFRDTGEPNPPEEQP